MIDPGIAGGIAYALLGVIVSIVVQGERSWFDSYRQGKIDRGECRECNATAVIVNGRSLRLCARHRERERRRSAKRRRALGAKRRLKPRG